jgi:lipopolysaccharide transport system ATP-binding protein
MSSKSNPNKAALRIRGLGKQYRLGEQSDVFTLTDFLGKKLRFWKRTEAHKAEQFWALRDIDYDLQQGQVLGVIGKNGSGKSTLLKILSRITPPTEGEFSYNGTVSSLLEVGTGFKPELTGYDNIFLSGTILGMKHREIKACLDDIIAFSEMERFIHTPVKRYSSGMYVRLAFAVAAHLDPDILLIDEVLAVGDMKFQRKCLERMGKVASEGRTVIFVSHNIQAVSQLCDQALLLNHGQMMASGAVKGVLDQYQELNRIDGANDGLFHFDHDQERPAHIHKIVIGPREQPKLNFDIMEAIDIELDFQIFKDLDNCMLELGVYTLDGMCVAFSRELDWRNYQDHSFIRDLPSQKGRYRGQTKIEAPLLNCGFYELRLSLSSPQQQCFHMCKGIQIEINDHDGSYSSAIVKATSHGVLTRPFFWQRSQN